MSAEPLIASAAADTGAVDADNPWPGLAAFREADQEFFHGRDAETEELLRLVLRDRLTVLFSLSGLGKTSLLQAGLFPRLRRENVLPVRIRLDFSEDHLPLVEQVKVALLREATTNGVEAPPLRRSETLWELFHRQGAELWSPRNRILTPLLAFDQFEEIFTLGREDAETDAFLDEIASLCEGSPPEDVRARLDEDPPEARTFSFNRHPYRLLLSLREDFLPDLEELRDRIRSIGSNRLRLHRMNGENALRVVTRAGGLLIAPGAAERVVRFVAGRPEEDSTPLADLNVEPALLSVVCRELNNKRRAEGASQITADLLQGNRDEILSHFYRRSVEDLDARVRTFIEESLLTVSGFRDSVALENALGFPGVTQEAIDKLTDRRLLRIEDRGGIERLELTHDVLTRVIRASRDSRREREAREQAEMARQEAEERERKARKELKRQNRILLLVSLLLAAVLVLGAWGFFEQRAGRKARSISDLGVAASLRDVESNKALAYLARALRTDPDNLVARTWITDLLLRRTWAAPVLEIRDGQGRFVSVDLSLDGRFLLTATKAGKVQLRDARTGRPIGSALNHPKGVSSARLSPDARGILTIGLSKTLRIWDTKTGKLAAELPMPDGELVALDFLPTSSTFFVSNGYQVWFLDTPTGSTKTVPLETSSGLPIGFIRFSRDERYLMTLDLSKEGTWAAVLREWPTGRILKTLTTSPFIITDANFNHDGTLLAIAFGEGKGQVWDIASGQAVGEPLRHGALISSIGFSRDGRKIVTASYDRTARVWDASTGLPLTEPLPHTDFVTSAQFSSDGRQVATISGDGAVRFWEIQTGKADSELLPAGGHVALSPDGSKVVSFSTTRINFQDLPSGQTSGRSLELAHSVNGLGLNDDGRYIATFSNPTSDGVEWDLREIESGRRICESPVRAADIVFSSRAEKLAIVKKDIVILCDTKTGKILKSRFPHHGLREAVALSPDGKKIVTVTSASGENVRIWDSETAAPIGKPLETKDLTTSSSFSPDGLYLLTGSSDGTARIWGAQTGISIGKPLRFGSAVQSIQFAPDSRSVMLTGEGKVSTFDMSTGKVLADPLFRGLFSNYRGMSADGAIVATSTASNILSQDDVIHIWQPRTGEPLASPLLKKGPLGDVVLHPEGRIVYFVLEDFIGESVHAWQISAGSSDDAETLARLAETAGGFRLDEDGRLVALKNWLAQIQEFRNLPPDDSDDPTSAAALARWFFADRSTRTLSPLSKITVPEFIRGRLARGTQEARDEVLKAYPDHPIVLEELRRAQSSPRSPN